MSGKHRIRKKANKKVKIGTLIGLLLFFVLMGTTILPAYFTQRFDEHKSPQNPFYIALRLSPNSLNPMISEYRDFKHDADLTLLWRENTTFEHQHLNAEVQQLNSKVYDLTLKSEIFTSQYRYRIDEQNRQIIPIRHKISGWIVWFYAIGSLIVATLLVTLVQWLLFWWKTPISSAEQQE